jgi:hypothetical protein
MPRGRWWPVAFAACLLTGGVGCGGNEKVAVQGSVTLDGQPVAGALVHFLPLGGGGQPATAMTDRAGGFRLGTLSPGDGAWPGDYKVVVTKTELDPALTERTDRPDRAQAGRPSPKARKALARSKKGLLPPVYGGPSTTPLRWTVPDENKKTLELQSRARS